MKKKRLLIYILIITLTFTVISYKINLKQYKDYKSKVNMVIINLIGEIKNKYPDIKEEDIIEQLNIKEGQPKGYELLNKFGIKDSSSIIKDLKHNENQILTLNIIILYILVALILIIIDIDYIKRKREVNNITRYIEEINKKNYTLIIDDNKEGELSILRNELYKTTIMLKEQAEHSLKDKLALQVSIEDISHQLKTPLTSISIMLDNIIDNPNMEKSIKEKFINEIMRQIEWINWLVVSLLKLSKLESGTVDFNKEEILIEKLINNVIKNLEIPLTIKNIELVTKGGSNVFFIGDYNWELEAMTNIIKNCIEHTQSNKKIYIQYEQNNFYTKIIIRDEGCGIEKVDLQHIFERFYKGKNSSQNSIGIGLALSKSIIEKDNGYIKVESEINEGTTFEIKYMK